MHGQQNINNKMPALFFVVDFVG